MDETGGGKAFSFMLIYKQWEGQHFLSCLNMDKPV
jgi:hypothetical protein